MIRRMQCRAERIRLNALRLFFGFDAWHASAPYACRPYKGRIVELANSVHPRTVAEIGCGLGDIVSRVGAQHRIGVDLDPRVIRAARFLHPRGTEWIAGSAADLSDRIAFVDCLIMVNWIHNLNPLELAAMLAPLLAKTRHLIVDAVDQDSPATYRFKHDFAFLSGTAAERAAIRVPNEPRRFLLFQTLV